MDVGFFTIIPVIIFIIVAFSGNTEENKNTHEKYFPNVLINE